MVRGDRGLVSPRLLVDGYQLVDWMFWGGAYGKRSLSVAAKQGFVINCELLVIREEGWMVVARSARPTRIRSLAVAPVGFGLDWIVFGFTIYGFGFVVLRRLRFDR